MNTKIITVSDNNDMKSIKKAARLLDDGFLVVFPTETVYGIGCRVHRKSLQRLSALKDRQPEKHYTLHVGSHDQIKLYLPSSLNMQARKLVANALPGPMTVVFKVNRAQMEQIHKHLSDEIFDLLYPDGTLGVRYPENPVAAEILRHTKFPIVAPSANPAGQIPAVTIQEVMSYFDGKIDYIVDAPHSGCTYKQSSTVVKVGKRGVDLLREGIISADQVRSWATIHLLFVCTGNTCRSPMAEGFCKKYFSDILSCQVDELTRFGYIIRSAGVTAFENLPASHNAVHVCQEQQIDVSHHRSHQLTPFDIQQCDLIFTMSRSHRDSIIQMLPSAAEKCIVLDVNKDIPDPVGMDIEVYRRCFKQIQESILAQMDKVL